MTDEICPQCVLGPGTLCENGVPYKLYSDSDYGNGNGDHFKCRAWKITTYIDSDELPKVCQHCDRTPEEIENNCCENCEQPDKPYGYCKYIGVD